MKVPFVDLRAQYHSIKNEMDKAVEEVLESTSFIMGPKLKSFEEQFVKLHESKYCLGTSAGTDALHLALWALGIGANDEVIVPVNTFIATAEGVSLSGATPVFVDINPLTYNIDPVKLEAAITFKTKAIIPVHLYGQPADMDRIMKIAKEHDIYVIEDACQAHLAKYKGKSVGSFGKVGCFSFYPGKNLGAYGEGGAVVTSDKELFEIMSQIRDHGSSQKYYHDRIGHNYRLETLQAVVLSVKLKYIQNWTEMRRENAQIYNHYLKEIEEITCPFEAHDCYHVYHLYVIRAKDRDALRSYLDEKGIATGLHYPIPLHLQKAYDFLDYKKGDFPVAEQAAEEILSLPMFPELTEEQIKYVTKAIKDFYSG